MLSLHGASERAHLMRTEHVMLLEARDADSQHQKLVISWVL